MELESIKKVVEYIVGGLIESFDLDENDSEKSILEEAL